MLTSRRATKMAPHAAPRYHGFAPRIRTAPPAIPQGHDMRRHPAVLILLAAGCTRRPTTPPAPSTSQWVATWTASPYAGPPRPPRDSVDRTPTFVQQTI